MPPGCRLALSAVLVLAACLGPALPCRAAGLVMEVPNLTGPPGSSGSFDVLLVNTNPAGGASYDVAADSIELAVLGPLGATFTGVSINTTTAPYIYVTSGTTVGGGPFSMDIFPNTQFTASDSEFAAPGFRTVSPGETFGLAHVTFAISPSSTGGTDTIMFVFPGTSLSDINGASIPFTTQLVPEPAALTEAATAALLGLGSFWWRRRRRGAAAQ
jgi:hypothetical protein